MADEAVPREPDEKQKRGSRWHKVGLGIAVFVLAYYGVTGGIRWYVSARITESEGQPLPEFDLQDLNGRRWTSAELSGKTTVLNFFRSKCSNCEKERDAIRQLVSEVDPSRVRIIGVMMDRVVAGISPETTAKTLARFGYTHPILMADRRFADSFHGAGWAHVTPVTYIVDASGRITRALRGHQTLESLRSAIP